VSSFEASEVQLTLQFEVRELLLEAVTTYSNGQTTGIAQMHVLLSSEHNKMRI
jgi:hypothetical protein